MTDTRPTRVAVPTPITAATVFLLALNLRPTVTSLGAAMEEVTAAPGSSAAIGAVLVALPLWAYSAGGWATPWLRAYWGTYRTVQWALLILGASLVARVVGGKVPLLAGTALACLAIAVIGAVLPVLVRDSSTTRATMLGASYTVALGAGSTVGALVTPSLVAHASWQVGLSAWAVLAAVTALVWRRAQAPADPSRPLSSDPVGSAVGRATAVRPSSLFHCPTARALTVYFGLVSTMTFLVMGWLPVILRDAGIPAGTAGLLDALAMAMGLPMMWLVPVLAARWRRQSLLAVLLVVPSVVGIGGLLLAPAAAPGVWAVGLGLGMGGLAFALVAIPRRAGQDAEVTSALSGMVQGIGYALAGVGALGCGLLHSSTGTWTVPLLVLLVVLAGQLVSGLLVARPRTVRPRPAGTRRYRRVGLPAAPQASA